MTFSDFLGLFFQFLHREVYPSARQTKPSILEKMLLLVAVPGVVLTTYISGLKTPPFYLEKMKVRWF